MTGVTGVKARRSRSVVLRIQGQADGVDAVAQIGWRPIALTREDMAEVAPAGGASDLDSSHAVTHVFNLDDGIAGEWRPERGPPAMGVELFAGAE